MELFFATPTKVIKVDNLTIEDLFYILEDLFFDVNFIEVKQLIEEIAKNLPISSLNNLTYYIMENNKDLYYFIEEILKSEDLMKLLEDKFYNSFSKILKED